MKTYLYISIENLVKIRIKLGISLNPQEERLSLIPLWMACLIKIRWFPMVTKNSKMVRRVGGRGQGGDPQVDRLTGPQGDRASQRQAEGGAENLIWL